MDNHGHLDPEKIIDPLVLLGKRISERFPEAGLLGVCEELINISKKAKGTSIWIAKPNIFIPSSKKI